MLDFKNLKHKKISSVLKKSILVKGLQHYNISILLEKCTIKR